MTRRRWFWFLGLFATGVLATALPWPPDLEGLGPVLLFCIFGLVGALVEIATSLRAPGRSAGPLPPIDARPADGEVGRVAVRGVVAEPNPVEPDFRRFLRTDPSWVAPRRSEVARRSALLGRVAIVSIFVGKDGRPWSDREIAESHKAMVRAGAWIEREAQRWGAPVNVDLADTYFVADDPATEDVEVAFVPEGDHEAPMEADAATKVLASASRAAAALGFADVADLIRRTTPGIEADVLVWLFHPRCAGRSLAISEHESGLPGVNLAVCYAREANFPEPLTGPPFADPVTFVHELLHLFGATDKYGVSLRSFPPRSVTDRDVMCLLTESLPRLRIDPLTANEIGWAAPGAPPPVEPPTRRRDKRRRPP
jgi:hypothetical protein